MADAPVKCKMTMDCPCPDCVASMAAFSGIPEPAAASSSDPSGASAPTKPWTLAALNYNAGRTVGSTYNEVADAGKLGSVYTATTEALEARGDWARLKATRDFDAKETKLPTSFSMLLGTAQGAGIPFSRLGYGMWPPPLVNYYRGFQCLCRKRQLVETLREGLAERPQELAEVAPESFLFWPAKADNAAVNELEQFRAVFAAGAAAGAKNVWILKPSGGAKGERIEVMRTLEDIERFMAPGTEEEPGPAGLSAWVVQRYLDKPLLLKGGRKFDMRCWVLLDAKYNAYLYKEGVLRTCAVKYTLDDLSNKFGHLSNHCIASKHPDYGKFEGENGTNEMFYAEFDAYLRETFPAAEFPGANIEAIVAQIKRLVRITLIAAKERMEVRQDYFSSFNLFGYDFLVDEDFNVSLCEINSSPAVADKLLPALVDDLIRTAVDPVFAPFDGEGFDAQGEGKAAWESKAPAVSSFEQVLSGEETIP